MNTPPGNSGDTPSIDTVVLGDVEVTRVVEWVGPIRTLADVVPDASRESRDHLAPAFRAPADGFRCAVQTWVLRTAGQTILVDTGVGNGRDRPHNPAFADWSTDFVARLADAGVHPDDVDTVVNTHIHADHVGWNTTPDGDGWVPTFRNAEYLIPRPDHDYFDPTDDPPAPAASTTTDVRRRGNALVFDDSIRPVLDAGQATLWEDRHRISSALTLTAAPGHTPGSSILSLRSGTERAMFVGDLLHSPVQLDHPAASSCFCLDPTMAATTRRRVLAEAADTSAIVVPAHFPGPGAAEIRRSATAFAVSRWAGFSDL